MAKSFFHALKTACISREDFDTREQAQTAVFEYIEVFYNRQRCHSAPGYLSRLRRLWIALFRHLFNVDGKLWISREHVVEGVFVERVEVTVVYSADTSSAGLAEE